MVVKYKTTKPVIRILRPGKPAIETSGIRYENGALVVNRPVTTTSTGERTGGQSVIVSQESGRTFRAPVQPDVLTVSRPAMDLNLAPQPPQTVMVAASQKLPYKEPPPLTYKDFTGRNVLYGRTQPVGTLAPGIAYNIALATAGARQTEKDYDQFLAQQSKYTRYAARDLATYQEQQRRVRAIETEMQRTPFWSKKQGALAAEYARATGRQILAGRLGAATRVAANISEFGAGVGALAALPPSKIPGAVASGMKEQWLTIPGWERQFTALKQPGGIETLMLEYYASKGLLKGAGALNPIKGITVGAAGVPLGRAIGAGIARSLPGRAVSVVGRGVGRGVVTVVKAPGRAVVAAGRGISRVITRGSVRTPNAVVQLRGAGIRNVFGRNIRVLTNKAGNIVTYVRGKPTVTVVTSSGVQRWSVPMSVANKLSEVFPTVSRQISARPPQIRWVDYPATYKPGQFPSITGQIQKVAIPPNVVGARANILFRINVVAQKGPLSPAGARFLRNLDNFLYNYRARIPRPVYYDLRSWARAALRAGLIPDTRKINLNFFRTRPTWGTAQPLISYQQAGAAMTQAVSKKPRFQIAIRGRKGQILLREPPAKPSYWSPRIGATPIKGTPPSSLIGRTVVTGTGFGAARAFKVVGVVGGALVLRSLSGQASRSALRARFQIAQVPRSKYAMRQRLDVNQRPATQQAVRAAQLSQQAQAARQKVKQLLSQVQLPANALVQLATETGQILVPWALAAALLAGKGGTLTFAGAASGGGGGGGGVPVYVWQGSRPSPTLFQSVLGIRRGSLRGFGTGAELVR